MKKFFLTLLFLGCFWAVAQEEPSDYYLPNHPYNPKITTPAEFLGYPVGEWHLSHDQLSAYVQLLAQESDRIQLERRGETFEGRPLWLLTVSSPQNLERITSIQKTHQQLSEASGESLDLESLPVVVYQGFSIHGNEPSGANASVLLAYHLAASQATETLDQLNNAVVLIDPCLNPDGFQRFANWVNSNRNTHLTSDNEDREYHEPWPRGRTNHYWFDLNRDWLPAQLPESQARIKTFGQWMPNVLTDHHEMGTNATFFFQPGIQSRVNPLTPAMNQELTRKMGTYHAKALDAIGSLYYTEESFDDFYYGKGSTYPDVNGGIGILFEQASSRGHLQISDNGLLSFPFSIRNQLTTAFSTLQAATEMRVELLQYFRQFYIDSRKLAEKKKAEAYVFGSESDPVRATALAQTLQRHGIKIHKARNSGKFSANAYAVPLNQKKIKLLQAMFNQQTQFQDSLFYDISAWSFPLAFNLPLEKKSAKAVLGAEITSPINSPKGAISAPSSYGYLIQNHSYLLPKAWGQLQKKGIRAKISMKRFAHEGVQYSYGTTFIPVQNQSISAPELHHVLEQLAEENALQINGVQGGLTQGIDLGSRNFRTLPKIRTGLLVGSGINAYDAGEIWHLWDYRWENPPVKLDVDRLSQTDLSSYSHLFLPSYGGSDVDPKILKKYVQAGGTLIAFRSSIRWLQKNQLIDINFIEKEDKASPVRFEERENYFGAQRIGGAIFETQLDRSHPINFGIPSDKLPMFRNTTLFMEADKDRFNNPIQYSKNPLLSGYISKDNLKLIQGSVPFKIQRLGRGKILMFTDNTQFRAFWFGTNRLLANAVFLSSFM